LEKAVLEMLVNGKAETFKILRKHILPTRYRKAPDRRRVLTYFSIPDSVERLPGTPHFDSETLMPISKAYNMAPGSCFKLKMDIFTCLKVIHLMNRGQTIQIRFIFIMKRACRETRMM